MTSLSVNRKREAFVDSMRPWLFGIPAFLIVSRFLLWYIARLASWIYVLLDVNK